MAMIRLLLAVLAVAAVGTSAQQAPLANLTVPLAAWRDRLFNYQLGQMFDVSKDLIQGVSIYFVDGADTPPATVRAMRAAGLIPVCYFSAGSYEDWRTDASRFKKADIGKPLDGWKGENWLDVRSPDIRPIMVDRIKNCSSKGFLAVDPDNVDVHIQDSGFPISADDMRAYLEFISNTAAQYGMATGLKNSMSLLTDDAFVQLFAFAVNEQCFEYDECDTYAPFKKAKKPVFQVEYTTSANFLSKACAAGVQSGMGVISINKKLELKAQPWQACPGAVAAALAALNSSSYNVSALGGNFSEGVEHAGTTSQPAGNSLQNAGSAGTPGWLSSWGVGLLLVLLGQLLLG